jgi:hypothetical protein
MRTTSRPRPNEQRKIEKLLVKLAKLKSVSTPPAPIANRNGGTENGVGLDAAMNQRWQVESGHLLCHWSETGQRVAYSLGWMEETSCVPSGYLPSVPDFASHSPFCGAFWFQPDAARQTSE